MVAHAFDSDTQEAGTDGNSVNLKVAWVSGQPRLHSETFTSLHPHKRIFVDFIIIILKYYFVVMLNNKPIPHYRAVSVNNHFSIFHVKPMLCFLSL